MPVRSSVTRPEFWIAHVWPAGDEGNKQTFSPLFASQSENGCLMMKGYRPLGMGSCSRSLCWLMAAKADLCLLADRRCLI